MQRWRDRTGAEATEAAIARFEFFDQLITVSGKLGKQFQQDEFNVATTGTTFMRLQSWLPSRFPAEPHGNVDMPIGMAVKSAENELLGGLGSQAAYAREAIRLLSNRAYINDLSH